MASIRMGSVLAAAALAWLAGADRATAQIPVPPSRPHVHRLHDIRMPPGEIGRQQLIQGRGMAGHYQPVEVRGPQGCQISVALQGAFSPSQQGKLKAGLLIGEVYRYKVSSIPLLEGYEVFPTIEVISRLYPPAGREAEFPVPVELTREELELAMQGHFVTRVIYLEDPELALGVQETSRQRYFEADAETDPLELADRLGRPMAILRMGSRVPINGDESEFTFGAPPLQLMAPAETPAAPQAPIMPAGGRPAAAEAQVPRRYPRLPQRYETDTPRRVLGVR